MILPSVRVAQSPQPHVPSFDPLSASPQSPAVISAPQPHHGWSSIPPQQVGIPFVRADGHSSLQSTANTASAHIRPSVEQEAPAYSVLLRQSDNVEAPYNGSEGSRVNVDVGDSGSNSRPRQTRAVNEMAPGLKSVAKLEQRPASADTLSSTVESFNALSVDVSPVVNTVRGKSTLIGHFKNLISSVLLPRFVTQFFEPPVSSSGTTANMLKQAQREEQQGIAQQIASGVKSPIANHSFPPPRIL
jgi:hypothetical protein